MDLDSVLQWVMDLCGSFLEVYCSTSQKNFVKTLLFHKGVKFSEIRTPQGLLFILKIRPTMIWRAITIFVRKRSAEVWWHISKWTIFCQMSTFEILRNLEHLDLTVWCRPNITTIFSVHVPNKKYVSLNLVFLKRTWSLFSH